MLEIIVHGLYVGTPHELGAAGALVTWGGVELARFHESYRRADIRSPLGAELRMLGTALEWAREHGGMGEVVVVRTGLGSLARAVQGRGEAWTPEIQSLVVSLERVARDFEGVHAEIAPAWITAPALEAALRSLIGLLEGTAWAGPDGLPGKRPPRAEAPSGPPGEAPAGRPPSGGETPRGAHR